MRGGFLLRLNPYFPGEVSREQEALTGRISLCLEVRAGLPRVVGTEAEIALAIDTELILSARSRQSMVQGVIPVGDDTRWFAFDRLDPRLESKPPPRCQTPPLGALDGHLHGAAFLDRERDRPVAPEPGTGCCRRSREHIGVINLNEPGLSTVWQPRHDRVSRQHSPGAGSRRLRQHGMRLTDDGLVPAGINCRHRRSGPELYGR